MQQLKTQSLKFVWLMVTLTRQMQMKIQHQSKVWTQTENKIITQNTL